MRWHGSLIKFEAWIVTREIKAQVKDGKTVEAGFQHCFAIWSIERVEKNWKYTAGDKAVTLWCRPVNEARRMQDGLGCVLPPWAVGWSSSETATLPGASSPPADASLSLASLLHHTCSLTPLPGRGCRKGGRKGPSGYFRGLRKVFHAHNTSTRLPSSLGWQCYLLLKLPLLCFKIQDALLHVCLPLLRHQSFAHPKCNTCGGGRTQQIRNASGGSFPILYVVKSFLVHQPSFHSFYFLGRGQSISACKYK